MHMHILGALDRRNALKTGEPCVCLQLHVLGFSLIGQFCSARDGSGRLALTQHLHQVVAEGLTLRSFEGAIKPIVSNSAGFSGLGSAPTFIDHEADCGAYWTGYAGLARACGGYGERSG